MDRSRCSACGVCDGLLQEMGRTFLCISVPEHRRQCSVGRKHNFLWGISLHSCELGLGSDCHFHNRHQETSFISLGDWIALHVERSETSSYFKKLPWLIEIGDT